MSKIEIQELIPPQAIDAEQSVLGAILQNQESLDIAIERMETEDFYLPKHKKIFQAVKDLYDKSANTDLLTVANGLVGNGELEEIGGKKYLVDLANSVVTFSNLEDHIKIVKDVALKNRLINECDEISRRCYHPETEAGEILDYAERRIFSAVQQGPCLRHIKDVMADFLGDVETAANSSYDTIYTGFPGLDRLILGLQKQYLILIAAETSIGKSALALNIASYASIKNRVPTLYVSTEMGDKQLVCRLLSSKCNIEGRASYKIRMGKLDDIEWMELIRTAGYISDSELIFADMPCPGLSAISAVIKRSIRKFGIRLVIVDYLQQIQTRGRSLNEETGQISQTLKGIARNFDIPVVALSQLSRGDGIPTLNRLRNSGSLEQDADQVIFIHRERNNKGDAENEGLFIVAKAKNEQCGSIEVIFNPKRTTFAEIDKNHNI